MSILFWFFEIHFFIQTAFIVHTAKLLLCLQKNTHFPETSSLPIACLHTFHVFSKGFTSPSWLVNTFLGHETSTQSGRLCQESSTLSKHVLMGCVIQRLSGLSGLLPLRPQLVPFSRRWRLEGEAVFDCIILMFFVLFHLPLHGA